MKLWTLTALAALALFTAPLKAHFEDGQIYVIDSQNSKVYFVNAANGWAWNESVFTSLVNQPGAIGFNHHGHMMLANYGDNTVIETDGAGYTATVLTAADGINGPWGPSGIVIGPGHGDVFITNFDTNEILMFDDEFGNGTVFADAGDGLVNPAGIGFLADGHMLVADRGGNKTLHHFDINTGVGTVFDVLPHQPIELAIRNNGDVYVLTIRSTIYRYVGGNPAARVLLGKYGPNSGKGGLDFMADHSSLLHINTTDATLREIDPDTGGEIIRAVLPGAPTSLVYVGNQHVPGTYIEFGESFPGTGGVGPTLHGSLEPRINQPTVLEAHSFVGGAPVILFLSTLAVEAEVMGAEFHIGLGPTSLFVIFSAGGTPGVAGDGDLTLPLTLPNDPALVGIKLYMQAAGVDAGAAEGYSFTQCLTMYIGE